MSEPFADRHGIEYSTGEHHPVTWDQARADAFLPPWVSDRDGRCFVDSDVEEVDGE